MKLEGIKFTCLLLACDEEIKESKENDFNNLNQVIETSKHSREFNENENILLEDLNSYQPVYIQKCNGVMKVMDGKFSIKAIQSVLNKLEIDYGNLILPCHVEYVKEFNEDKLKQIRPTLNINIGECDMNCESGKLTIPKSEEVDKIDKAHQEWILGKN